MKSTKARLKILRGASETAIWIVGIVLILAGTLKLIGIGAEDMIEGLENAHLIQHLSFISLLAIACGVVLLFQITRPLGVLLSSSYWGGAIVAHLTYNDSFAMPATFLGILWLGVLLGSPTITTYFGEGQSEAAETVNEPKRKGELRRFRSSSP